MPKISIIIPVYNTAQFLNECVGSIVGQNFDDWELILVDDGSTDDSGDICDKFSSEDRRIKVFHIANNGVSYARNFGISQSRGEFLFFSDSDDVVDEECLSVLYDLTTTSSADIGAVGFWSGRFDRKPMLKSRMAVYEGAEAVSHILYQKYPDTINCSVWAKLFRRNLFDENLTFPAGRFEDLALVPQVFLKAKRVAVDSRAFYFYRSHQSSFMNLWSRGRLDVLRVTEDIERRFAGDPILSKAASDRRFSANYNILMSLYSQRRDLPEIERQCWGQIKSRRIRELKDKNVRIKNKLGALVSFGGRRILKFIARLKRP